MSLFNTGKRPVDLVAPVLAALALAGCAGTRERIAFRAWHDDAGSVAATADSAAVDFAPTADPGVESYITAALRRNRGLASARREWKAALEKVPQARTLPDPVLSYGVFLQSVETRVGPQRHKLGLTQEFPWFGTLGLRAGVALSEAGIVHERYRQRVQETVRDVTVAYAEFYYLGAALRITRDTIELLEGWESILRSRYTTGSVSYSDLIKVQVELGRLEDRLTTLESERAPRMARLAALLDLSTGAILPWPAALPDPWPLETRDVLKARILADSPELRAAAARIETQLNRRRLAARASYPGLALGVDWTEVGTRDIDLEDNGKDAFTARLALKLPLWTGGRSAARRQAEAGHEAAVEGRRHTRNMLESELESLIFAFEDAKRKTALYRDSLIPKGNQSLQAAFAAFESGDGDFLSVLDAERALLEFGLSLERARADRVGARAGIVRLTGQAPTWRRQP